MQDDNSDFHSPIGWLLLIFWWAFLLFMHYYYQSFNETVLFGNEMNQRFGREHIQARVPCGMIAFKKKVPGFVTRSFDECEHPKELYIVGDGNVLG